MSQEEIPSEIIAYFDINKINQEKESNEPASELEEYEKADISRQIRLQLIGARYLKLLYDETESVDEFVQLAFAPLTHMIGAGIISKEDALAILEKAGEELDSEM